MIVQHRHRMAPPRGQREVADKIHLPKIVGVGMLEPHECRVPDRLAGVQQLVAAEDAGDGAGRRNLRHAQRPEPVVNLAAAPRRVLAAEIADALLQVRAGARWRLLRTPRLVHQHRSPRLRARLGTAEPLVAGLAADPKTPAQQRDVAVRLPGH